MHIEITQWFNYVKTLFPHYYQGMKVLDVGSLDVNGNNRGLFTNCRYTGLDVGPGPNVDIVSVCHEFLMPEASYDVVISSDALEHDMFYEKTLKKMSSLLKPNGLWVFTCATEGRGEHGTLKECDGASPLTTKIPEWQNYYKNLTEKDIRDSVDIDGLFIRYEFSVVVGSLLNWGKDLRFWGIKR